MANLMRAPFSCRSRFLAPVYGVFALFLILWVGIQFEIVPYILEVHEASPEWTPSLCRPPPDGRPPVLACCGHRGAPRLAPENTLPSFRKALEVGANCIELDAHLTRDRRLAVVHGKSLAQHLLPKNYTGQLPRVEDLSWDQIRRLDGRVWFGREFKRVRVPALEDVVRAFWDRQVQVIVELKVDACVPGARQEWQAGDLYPAAAAAAAPDAPTDTEGREQISSCPAEGVWEHLYAETLLEWVRKFPQRKNRPPKLGLVFTSFNFLLIDNLVRAWRPIELEDGKGPLESRVHGFAYIYGPQAANVSITGTPGSDWLAVHDSLVPHVGRGNGRIISWVTDGLTNQLEQVKMGVQSVTTNDPTTCPALCNSARRVGGDGGDGDDGAK